jgi:hypothetical protein
MTMVSCPGCGAQVSELAPACASCGRPLHSAAFPPPPPPLPPAPVASAWGDTVEIALHPMSGTKLLVMSLCTFGLYHIYWFYRNWRLRNELRRRGVTAPLRALFAPIFAFSLFEDVDVEVRRWGVTPGWSAAALAIAYFLLNVVSRLPDPLWIISLLSVLPLLAVQRSINQANARSTNPAPVNASFSGFNIAGIVLGGLFLLLGIVGAFMPEP